MKTINLENFSDLLTRLSIINQEDYFVLNHSGVLYASGSNLQITDEPKFSLFSKQVMAHEGFSHTICKIDSEFWIFYGHSLTIQEELTGSALVACEKIHDPDLSDRAAAGKTPRTKHMAGLFGSLVLIFDQKWTSDIEAEEYAQELSRNFEENYLYSKIISHMKSIGLSNALFKGILKEIFNTMQVDLAFAIMPEYPENDETIISKTGIQNIKDQGQFIHLLINSIPVENTSLGKQFFIVNDSQADMTYQKLHPNPFRFLAVMIKRKNVFYGWLGFLSFNISRIFVNSELKLLKTVTSSAAVAMENSNLYAESIKAVQKEGDLRRKFQKYVPEMVVDEILNQDVKDLMPRGVSRDLTLLNVDIRGYSMMSKQLRPEDMLVVINYFFRIMGKIILKRRGIIDKYLGDGILAIFGAPVETPHPELDATLAAMEMVTGLEDVNNFIKRYGIQLNIGVSIHAGEAIVGNIGFENKMEYTVIGDMVNNTFLLQEITKEKMNSVMISKAVHEKIASFVRVRSLGKRMMGGKESQMEIFEVLGRKHLQNPAVRG